MSYDGVWISEILGPEGWGSAGTLVLNSSRAFGGNNDCYFRGTYVVNDGNITITLTVWFYGTPPPLFKCAGQGLRLELQAKRSSHLATGTLHCTDDPELSLGVRLTRRAALPAGLLDADRTPALRRTSVETSA